MNNDSFKGEENNSTQKEEIKFEEWENNNPYSRYGTAGSQDRDGASASEPDRENPYSRYHKKDEEPEPEYFGKAGSFTLLAEAKEKKNISRIGFGYALFSAISLTAALIIQLVVLAVYPTFYDSTLFLNLLSPISLYLFALPFLLILLSGCKASPPEKKNFGIGEFILYLIVSFGVMYIGSYIGSFLMDFISACVGYDYSNALTSIIDYDNLWITAIFTVIVAPIGEELVFRKLFIDRTRKYGTFVSVGLSALMFGLMHGNFYQFFYAFGIGLILGYIYYTTGKLYLTVLIHAIVNFVGSILSSMLLPSLEAFETLDLTNEEALMSFLGEHGIALGLMLLLSMFIYASMICAVVLPIIFRKKIKLDRGEAAIPRDRVLPVVIFNAGIIVMLAVYILEFSMSLIPG